MCIMTGAAGPAAKVSAAHAAHPGEKQGSPVNLASRSGVLGKLSVTAEMSTTEHNHAVLEVGREGGLRRGRGSSMNRKKRERDHSALGRVVTGRLLCMNGSVEKGGFEQQKLMEGGGT